MITVNLMGGMGNLMFQYAYGRALEEKYKEKLVFNQQFMNLICLGVFHRPNTNNALRHLNIPANIKYKNSILGYISGVKDTIKFLNYRKRNNGKYLYGQKSFTKMTKRGYFFTDDYLSYYKENVIIADKKYVIGGFNSLKYFENIQDKIHKELKVITPPSKENQEMIKKIQKNTSVCVHIRRGDYVSNTKNSSFVVCNQDYYKKGMNYITSHIKNPVFYIFSDNNKEINWIKYNYKFDYPVNYVELNNPDYEELRLMYSCKHFIISNSTFSWWASFLSDNKQKIVIAPNPWNNNYNAKFDIYTDYMTILD